MGSKKGGQARYRDSNDGQFIKKPSPSKNPATWEKEHINKPGKPSK